MRGPTAAEGGTAAPAGRAAAARGVEHPGAAAHDVARARVRVPLRGRRRRVRRRRRLEHRRGVRRGRGRAGPGRLRDHRPARRDGHPRAPRPLRAGRPAAGGVGRVDLPAPGGRRPHPEPLHRPDRAPRAHERDDAPRRGARRRDRVAHPRRDAGAPARRPGPARHPPRGRRPARGQGLGPEGHLDARALTGPPLLLGAGERGAAVGRPRAPRITPNIPFHPQAGDNPLGDFIASLDKVDQYPAGRSCPPTSTASSTCTVGSSSSRPTTSTASARSSRRCGPG